MVETAINLVFAITFLALWRQGALPERIAVATLGGTMVLDRFYHTFLGEARYVSVDLGHLAIDVIGVGIFLTLALRANRVWPMWCCSLQLIMTIGHLGEAVYRQGAPMAYWAMTFPPAAGQLIVVVCGTIAHSLRTRRIGHYRNWRTA